MQSCAVFAAVVATDCWQWLYVMPYCSHFFFRCFICWGVTPLLISFGHTLPCMLKSLVDSFFTYVQRQQKQLLTHLYLSSLLWKAVLATVFLSWLPSAFDWKFMYVAYYPVNVSLMAAHWPVFAKYGFSGLLSPLTGCKRALTAGVGTDRSCCLAFSCCSGILLPHGAVLFSQLFFYVVHGLVFLSFGRFSSAWFGWFSSTWFGWLSSAWFEWFSSACSSSDSSEGIQCGSPLLYSHSIFTCSGLRLTLKLVQSAVSDDISVPANILSVKIK